jgi:hypothetical protein
MKASSSIQTATESRSPLEMQTLPDAQADFDYRAKSMMRNKSWSLWVACLIGIAGYAGPPTRTAAPATNYFDCDVPPGRFSRWNQTIVSNDTGLSGTLQMIEGRKDPKWRPSASVYLIDSDTKQSAGLKMILFNEDPDDVYLVILDSGGKTEHDILASVPWAGKAVAFSVRLTGPGELTVTADGRSDTVHLPGFRPRKLELVCSTGQFKFAEVVIGGSK